MTSLRRRAKSTIEFKSAIINQSCDLVGFNVRFTEKGKKEIRATPMRELREGAVVTLVGGLDLG